jgi:hypothetical protein
MSVRNPLLKPRPLPPCAGMLSRLEYVLQLMVYWIVIDIPGKSAVSGLLSAIVMLALLILIVSVISHLWR